MTKRIYMARVPGTGYFIRCPRWIYNHWPWAGLVRIWDVPDSPTNAGGMARELAAQDSESTTDLNG